MAAADPLTSRVELLVPPGVEPLFILKLHQWLVQTANGEIETVIPALSADTVIVATFEEPVPLMRMLRQLPFVTEAIALPEVEGGRMLPGGGWGSPPRQTSRIQLMLKGA